MTLEVALWMGEPGGGGIEADYGCYTRQRVIPADWTYEPVAEWMMCSRDAGRLITHAVLVALMTDGPHQKYPSHRMPFEYVGGRPRIWWSVESVTNLVFITWNGQPLFKAGNLRFVLTNLPAMR